MPRHAEFIDEPKPDEYRNNCLHDILAYKNSILLYNNDDCFYTEEFKTREEAEEFLFKFQDMIELAFPKES